MNGPSPFLVHLEVSSLINGEGVKRGRPSISLVVRRVLFRDDVEGALNWISLGNSGELDILFILIWTARHWSLSFLLSRFEYAFADPLRAEVPVAPFRALFPLVLFELD